MLPIRFHRKIVGDMMAWIFAQGKETKEAIRLKAVRLLGWWKKAQEPPTDHPAPLGSYAGRGTMDTDGRVKRVNYERHERTRKKTERHFTWIKPGLRQKLRRAQQDGQDYGKIYHG
jgi:hypothetical protein